MPKKVDINYTPWFPERDNLIYYLRKAIDNAKLNYVRDRVPNSQRKEPARGITETFLLGDGLSAKYRHFLHGRNKLTESVFQEILIKLLQSEWPERDEDIRFLKQIFISYTIADATQISGKSTSLKSAVFITRAHANERFCSLLEINRVAVKDLLNVSQFIDFTNLNITNERRIGSNGKAVNNACILFDGLIRELSLTSILKQSLADCLSFLAFQGAYAAFQAEDLFGHAECLARLQIAADLGKGKYTAISLNMAKHQYKSNLIRKQSIIKSSYLNYKGEHFAGIAFDAFFSSLPNGLIDELPFEPGTFGNAALEYELTGAPMTFKPDRFGKRSLADVLLADIEASEAAGGFEGAARLSFGLGRGFLRTDLDEAENALDRGYTALSMSPSYHSTARAKGLLLEAQLIGAQRGRRASGRVADKLTEARTIYLEQGAQERFTFVEMLLKKWL